MIKCAVIKEFTLERFDELKNIERKTFDTKGKLYVGDTFECDKQMADYLMGANKGGQVVVKIIEIDSKFEKDSIEPGIKIQKVKPSKDKKYSKK